MKTSLVILLSVATYCMAESDKENWLPEEFPNPIENPELCSISGTTSHICDPHQYINKVSNFNQLDFLIKRVRDDTDCMCSDRYCSDVFQTGGVKIGIAIVNKMADSLLKEEKTYELKGRLHAASEFTQYLDKAWSLASCDDSIMIFYSVNDHVLFTHTGSAVKDILDNNLIAEISIAHRDKFESRMLFDGFAAMIDDFHAVLDGKYEPKVNRVERPADPQAAALYDGNGAGMTSYQILTTLVMLVVTLVAHL